MFRGKSRWSSCGCCPWLEQMIPDLPGATLTQLTPMSRQRRQRLAACPLKVNPAVWRQPASVQSGRHGGKLSGAEWRIQEHQVEAAPDGSGAGGCQEMLRLIAYDARACGLPVQQ